MKYAILTYETKRKNFNIGDYIQSVAAAQYLPQVDLFLNREQLDRYTGEPVKLILNGWFMSHPEHWPPASAIRPLPVAFHMEACKAGLIAGPGQIGFFKKYQPIGCRDRLTARLLSERGVATDYTGCLTLTLGRTYRADQASGKVYFVDVLCKEPSWYRIFSSLKMLKRCWKSGKLLHPWAKQRALDKLFSRLGPVHRLTQNLPCVDYPTPEARFALARQRLEEFSHARLVVTSRIHCALPCLGMGTPVVFVAGGFDPADTAGRVGDFFELCNTIRIDERGRITANFDLKAMVDGTLRNPEKHRELAQNLMARCERFVADGAHASPHINM